MKFETLSLHAGYTPDQQTNSRAVPVHRTSAYLFKDTQHAENLFGLKELGYIYTRLGNPTQDVLEQRVAALEKAPAAVAIASGTSAIFYAIINLAKNGDEIIAASNLYGGTFTMLNDILPDLGITTKFFNPSKPEEISSLVTAKTRAIFVESIGNPALEMVDFAKVSEIAKKSELPLIVDSTFTTPYLFNPIEHGANIIVHSLTKWMGGHGTGIGGIVVDCGNFDWTIPKFSLFNEPDPSYHNLRYAHDLGDMNKIAYALRLRLVPLRNLGAAIAPDNAWMFLQGIETLALRMERHSENALAVAKVLKSHPGVSWVKYPGLEGSAEYTTASKYLKKGFGGMVIFGIKGGLPAGRKFIESLKIFSHLANVGDAKSLAIHPASTTHSQLSAEDQLAGGITPDLIRLSIGIENIDDILEDINQALKN